MTHVYVTWLMYMWHDSCICDMTHVHVTWLMYMWHDSCICDMTHVYVTWLICVCIEKAVCTACCIWGVVSSISNLNQWSSSFRSLLPRSVEKRPRRLRMEIENKRHSKCKRLHTSRPFTRRFSISYVSFLCLFSMSLFHVSFPWLFSMSLFYVSFYVSLLCLFSMRHHQSVTHSYTCTNLRLVPCNTSLF